MSMNNSSQKIKAIKDRLHDPESSRALYIVEDLAAIDGRTIPKGTIVYVSGKLRLNGETLSVDFKAGTSSPW